MNNGKTKLTTKDCINCGLCCYFPKRRGLKFYKDKIVIGENDFCIHYTDGKGCDIHNGDRAFVCELLKLNSPECLHIRKKYRNVKK